MLALRTLLASACLLFTGGLVIATATHNFQAFTTATAHRIEVRQQPVKLPAVALETQAGEHINLAAFHGQWLAVDFIYTTCPTYCVALGSEFAQLQEQLATPLAQGRVALLSISFDPQHDTPQRLKAYQQHAGSHGAGWYAARPVNTDGLAQLEQSFGVTVIPDAFGGYTHNAAIGIVNPQGQLVDILDQGDPQRVAETLQRALEQ